MLSNPKKNTQFRIHNGKLSLFHKTDNHLDYWKHYWEDGSIINNNLNSGSADLLEFNTLFDKYLPVSKDKTILEAGCGAGLYVNAFYNRGNKIIGIDYEQQVIDNLQENFPGIDYRYGNILGLDFADGSIDYYVSLGVLEHFEDATVQKKAIDEAYRVLADDGLAFISVPYLNPGREKHRAAISATKTEAGSDYNFHQYYYSVKEFSSILQAHGFKVIDTYGYACMAFIDRESSLKNISKKLPWRLKKMLNSFFKNTGSRFVRNEYAHMMMYVCTK